MGDLRSRSRKEEVQIREEFGVVQHRRYNSTSIFCDITTSGDWQEFHTTIPIEMSLYAAATIVKETMEGDEAELLVGDEVQVAANAEPVAVDDDELTLSGVSYFRDLGRVLEIDEDASTIKVENAAVHAFAAGKAVKMQVKMGHSLKFAGAGAVNFGSAMIGGSLIPAGTKIRVRYKNNQGTAKKMMLMLEYRY
jgi:hypothetical protein